MYLKVYVIEKKVGSFSRKLEHFPPSIKMTAIEYLATELLFKIALNIHNVIAISKNRLYDCVLTFSKMIP